MVLEITQDCQTDFILIGLTFKAVWIWSSTVWQPCLVLKKSSTSLSLPIKGMESAKWISKNSNSSDGVSKAWKLKSWLSCTQRLNVWNEIQCYLFRGIKRVTVNDLSWFGRAIIIKVPLGQICKKLGGIINWNQETVRTSSNLSGD